jgi:hypothetical protein
MSSSVRQKHDRRLEQLKTERLFYESLWGDYDKFIVPGRLRLTERSNKGEKKYENIVDETALLAYRTLRSGMQSGQTSPARPWFRLGTFDPGIKDYGPVKDFLFQSQTRMRQVMNACNYYNVQHNGYGDLAQFGQSAKLLVPDDGNVVRAIPLLTGQYWIAQSSQGRVDTMYRKISMTTEQIVGRFVAQRDGSMDWSRVSTTIKALWDRGDRDEWIIVSHAIEPRMDREHGKQDKRNKPFTSNYWEDGANRDVMLDESGFSYNPIIAPRWETIGEDIYGSHHPGDIALSGIKVLQVMEKRHGIAVHKKVDPPMTGPTSMKNNGSSTLPGTITYVDSIGQQQGFRPALEVNIDLSHLDQKISNRQRTIERAFYADLFMAITNMEGIQPKNVFELTQRKEEQLLQLGPVIDRQQNEDLNPTVDIFFALMAESGLLPEMPKEIQNQKLKIEHVSVLAQAQKAISTGAIERVLSFVGNLAGIKPDVMDKIDTDQAIDEYADAVGAPPTIVRSDDAVEADRNARQQQQQQAANAEMASQMAPVIRDGAQAAKLLSEAGTVRGDSSLVSSTDLLSRLGISG